MSVKDVIKMNAITILDISDIDDEDYFGEEWALLHCKDLKVRLFIDLVLAGY